MSTDTDTRTISRYDLTEAFECADLFDFDIREDYSGRGMNGATCFGVILDHDELNKVHFAFGYMAGYREGSEDDEGRDNWSALARCARTDSMGRQAIVYFRGWQLD